MREKLYALLLIILFFPADDVNAKESNNTEKVKRNTKLHHKDRILSRQKRALLGEDKFVLPGRVKRQNSRSSSYDPRFENDDNKIRQFLKNGDKINEPPFWGTRGRRDSGSDENFIETEDFLSQYPIDKYCHYCRNLKHCKNCYGTIRKEKYDNDDDSYDFWDRVSRKSFDENDEPFWGNRGRRQEDDDPFWGTRGRRKEDDPFWGNRGRRENQYQKIDGQNYNFDSFWENRGPRQESEPFWGNRGRRMQSREENDDSEPFWGNRGRRKEDLKESIMNAMNDIENNIENLSRYRRNDETVPTHSISQSFWANRGRQSKLKNLFQQKDRMHPKNPKSKPYEPGTVLNDRMYAEEPRFILIERSSRSSKEDDPYFITRGKKRYFVRSDMDKAARDRRSSIEEIVKSVRNDPYYIARGKKDDDNSKIDHSTFGNETLAKVKELICSSVDLISSKSNKVKRETGNENDRDRRMILKKLAAQLQIDPYFVSRGKKNGDILNNDYLEEFVNDVADKCN